MQFHHKWLLLGVLAGLLIALPVLILATKQTQETRSHASGPDQTDLSQDPSDVDSASLDNNQEDPTQTTDSNIPSRKMAVIMVRFKDDPSVTSLASSEYTADQLKYIFFGDTSNPATPIPSGVQKLLYSVASFHKTSSNGSFNLTGDVINWVTDSQDTRAQACKSGNDAVRTNIATAVASQYPSINLNSYQYKFYYYTYKYSDPGPGQPISSGTCDWRAITPKLGISIAAGKFIQQSAPRHRSECYGGNFDQCNTDNWAHEVGHLRSFNHSQGLNCHGKSIDVISNCTYEPYGDSLNLMGFNNYYHADLDAYRKSLRGDLPKANIVNISSATTQNYTLYTSSKAESGTQLIKISRSAAEPNHPESFYYLEYRQPVGLDSNLTPQATGGVLIRIAKSGLRHSETLLVDTHPSGGDNLISNFKDAAMTDNQTFNDPLTGLTIKQISHNSNSVVINIAYNPAATGSKPTAKPTKVPTVKPTAGVTSAPTPTETTSGNSSLNVTILVPGIGLKGNKNPKMTKKRVIVDVYSAGGTKVGSFNKNLNYQNSTGVYSGQIPVTIPSTGAYNLYFSSAGYLKQRVDSALTLGGSNNIAQINFAGGDLNDDGVRNLLDWNIMRACLVFPASRDPKVCPDGSVYMQNADMDSSGTVDQDDITLWILQYQPK